MSIFENKTKQNETTYKRNNREQHLFKKMPPDGNHSYLNEIKQKEKNRITQDKRI